MSEPATVFTVGHSTHAADHFLDLLKRNGVTAIADVRSIPFSRHSPQFNRDRLSALLREQGIAYAFLGKELGARSQDPACYVDGKVQYDRMAQTAIFKASLGRVLKGAQKHRIALMCAEKEPLDCHRTILVGRALERLGASIVHILPNGKTETNAQAMARLISLVGIPPGDLLRSHDEQVQMACKLREQKIAYMNPAFARA